MDALRKLISEAGETKVLQVFHGLSRHVRGNELRLEHSHLHKRDNIALILLLYGLESGD